MTFDERLQDAMREVITAVKFALSLSDKEAQNVIADVLVKKPLMQRLLCDIALKKADEALNN